MTDTTCSPTSPALPPAPAAGPPSLLSVAARSARSRAPNAPKIDYKDVKLLQRYISERGKIVPVAHHRRVPEEATRTGQGHQARPLSWPCCPTS